MRVLAVAIGFLLSMSVAAQEAPIFTRLAGNWRGAGELMGRPAQFSMRWDLLPGDIALLTFQNPFIQSSALYRTTAALSDATWYDSRGVAIRIQWTATDSALTAVWTAPTESGRTVYQVTPDGMDVTDYVHTDTGERLFGRARYMRVEASVPAADEARIREEVATIAEDMLAALRARDADRAMAFYDSTGFVHYDDGIAVPWSVLAPQMRGFLRAAARLDLAWIGLPVVVVLAGDAALVRGVHRFSGTLADGTELPRSEGTWTGVFRRGPEGWKLLHSHSSDVRP